MTATLVAADPEVRHFVESLRRCCERELPQEVRSRDPVIIPNGLWTHLGELGVLGLGVDWPESATLLVAGFTELGARLCPGPLVATLMATLLLPEDADALRAGRLLASVGAGGVYPWGEDAEILIEVDGDDAWLVEAAGDAQPMTTLAREPWARVPTRRVRYLDNGVTAAATGDLAVAAMLLGAASRLLQGAAAHARVRHQFGRAIGSFQAVAFPLAACHAALHVAANLTARAAQPLHGDPPERAMCAAARTITAAAALRTLAAAHQVYGGIGFTEETGIAAISTRLRQWSLLPPTESGRTAALLAAAAPDHSAT